MAATIAPEDRRCAFGGAVIQTGIDDNRNGTLDTEEVDDARVSCNTSLPSGASPLISSFVASNGMPVAGETVTLMVGASDSAGGSALTYSWFNVTEQLLLAETGAALTVVIPDTAEVGDTIVLCPGRMLRDGGARVLDGDEAYTIVEAEIDNLPAALREIKRLRTELAARPPAPPWLGRRTPADEGEAAADGDDGDAAAAAADTEGEAAADADDADADDKTEDARGGASDDDDATDRGTKRRAADDDAEPPAEAKRRRRGNCVIC